MASTSGEDASPPFVTSQLAKVQLPSLQTTQNRRHDGTSPFLEVEQPSNLLPDAEGDEVPLEKQLESDSDDDKSIGSFTEAVLDTKPSLASKATLASSFHVNSDTMMVSFVDILIGSANMDSLLTTATAELGLSSGGFTKSFSRIFESYVRTQDISNRQLNLVAKMLSKGTAALELRYWSIMHGTRSRA